MMSYVIDVKIPVILVSLACAFFLLNKALVDQEMLERIARSISTSTTKTTAHGTQNSLIEGGNDLHGQQQQQQQQQ